MRKSFIIMTLFITLASLTTAQEPPIAYIYGGSPNGSNDTIIVNPGSWIDVPIYFGAGEDSVFGADLVYYLGISNCYFDEFDTSGFIAYYPLSEWDALSWGDAWFDWMTDSFGCVWDSYGFFGFWDIVPPYGNSPFLTLVPGEPPVHALTFRIHANEYITPGEHISCNAIGTGRGHFFKKYFWI